jgi:hypothetical protein
MEASTKMISGMLPRVVWQRFTDVSEVLTASIIMAMSIDTHIFLEGKIITVFLSVFENWYPIQRNFLS